MVGSLLTALLQSLLSVKQFLKSVNNWQRYKSHEYGVSIFTDLPVSTMTLEPGNARLPTIVERHYQIVR